MMLTEITAVASGALPMAEFRDHLRLGTGFADLGAADAALESYLRAALAAIEGRTSKALIAREFRLELEAWRYDPVQALPVSPVSAVSEMRVFDRAGAGSVVPSGAYRLVRDMARPRIEAEGMLPSIPVSGRVEIVFTAGFGIWEAVPVDLRQAVLLLAATYYETRLDAGGQASAMPFGVMALIERWRVVRVLGGRG